MVLGSRWRVPDRERVLESEARRRMLVSGVEL